MRIFVEGGGDTRAQQAGARKAFKRLFEKAGLAGRLPAVEACGTRTATIRDFTIALDQKEPAALLVDSEGPVVVGGTPSGHLIQRGEWTGPAHEGIHLMVEVMETWLLSQPEALRQHFGPQFNDKRLPQSQNLESIQKLTVYRALDAATASCPKGAYSRAKRQGFDILATLDVEALEKRLPHARKFFEYLRHAKAKD